MTPEAFTKNVNAWIDAGASILTHLALKLAVVLALPAWMQIRARLAQAADRLDRHRDELETIKGHISSGENGQQPTT